MTGPSEGLDGIDDPARKKGSRLERESAEARERRGNLKEIPQQAFFTGGCLLLTRGPPRKMIKMLRQTRTIFLRTSYADLP